MADVTFGVKVPEEMKIELSDIMKNTDLSGKEFMNMLLTAYKLESNKKQQNFYAQDIEELQRLLNRIQGIYLNLGQKTEFIIEEKLQDGQKIIEEKELKLTEFLEKIDSLEKAVENKEKTLKESKKNIDEMNKNHLGMINELDDSKKQLKNNQLLYDKYESEIKQLQKTIEGFKRLELEIEERNEENQKLKTRNDEIASEMWFLQRDMDKLKEELAGVIVKSEEDQDKIKKNYELELKNQLLEQKLEFNNQINLLKEANFNSQQEYTQKMQDYLEESIRTNKDEK
ncbi:MAG: hypothetical protein RR744_04280 [Cellulosilyticaceae bacterium]